MSVRIFKDAEDNENNKYPAERLPACHEECSELTPCGFLGNLEQSLRVRGARREFKDGGPCRPVRSLHFKAEKGIGTIETIIVNNIIDSIPVGLLVIDPQGVIVVSNRCVRTILGYSEDTLAGKGWADLFFEREENDLFNQVIVDVIWEQRLNLDRFVPYTQPGGNVLYLSITTSFIKSERGTEGIVVLLDDITELHRIQANERIILKEKENLQRDRTEGLHKLAMAVAHQVRNPTTAIGGLALLMLKQAGSDSIPASYLQNIINCVQRLETIVASIQEYTQIPSVSRSLTTMDRILAEVEEHAALKALSIGKKIDLRTDSTASEVEVDPQLLVRALKEILDNAIEFGGNGKVHIKIEVSRNRTELFITVTDDGIGISPNDLPYVFDPFFSTKAVGVGMGLCKVKRIVSEHGGQVWAEKAEGKGSRIIVQIPDLLENLSTEGDTLLTMDEMMLNDQVVLNLKGRLDAGTATDLKDKVKECLKKGQIRIIIDLAEIDFVDSSGLGCLVTCLRTVNKAGGDLKIAALNARIRAVFELVRLHHVFDIYDDSCAASMGLQSWAPSAL